MGVGHVLDMIQPILPAGVMCWPVSGLSWAFPVVIGLQPGRTLWVVQMRTIIGRRFFSQHAYLVRGDILADRGDVLDHSAVQRASSVLYQASRSISTRDPVVDVGFDHEFRSDLFPQVEFHGSPLCLTQRCRRWLRNISICWPRRSRRDRITSVYKIPNEVKLKIIAKTKRYYDA